MTQRLYGKLGRANAAACCRLRFDLFFFSIVFIVVGTKLVNHRPIVN